VEEKVEMAELNLAVPRPADLQAEDLVFLQELPEDANGLVRLNFWELLDGVGFAPAFQDEPVANLARVVEFDNVTIVLAAYHTEPHVVDVDHEGNLQMTQATECPYEVRVKVYDATRDASGLEVRSPWFRPFGPAGETVEGLLEAAVELRHLPVAVGQIGGVYGLVLTGMGQDFTLAVAEAYVRMGYLPPADMVFDLLQQPKTQNERIARLAIYRSALVRRNRLADRLRREDLAQLGMTTDEFQKVTR
jgi:hypothetical protein